MDSLFLAGFITCLILNLVNIIITFAVVRSINTRISGVQSFVRGEIIPEFQAEDMESKKITLSNYAHHDTAFIFFSTTCLPCRDEVPRVDQTIRQGAQQSEIKVVFVSVDNKAKTKAFCEEFNIHTPTLVQSPSSKSFSEIFKVRFTPSYCIFGQDKRIKQSGSLGDPGWTELLEKMVGPI